MIDPKLGYSPKTQELIERMCRNVERSSFVLNKAKAEECILKTYDLFRLKRPKKIVWCVDVFNKEYNEAINKAWLAGSARSEWLAGLAGSAGSARSEWLAGLAGSAGSARLAWLAGSAGSARLAWLARSEWSARLAWSARSEWLAGLAGSARSEWLAGLAGSARLAIDYDFDWFVIEFEYCQNPNKSKLPNENDFKYLEYSELLMQAKEYGLGCRVEWKDTFYLVPTPLVKIDEQNRFHSEHYPAINWIGGKGLYYLHGVNFPKELWLRLVNRQVSMQEILAIDDIDQRVQAIKYAKDGIRDFYKSQGGKMIDHYVKMDKKGRPINYELWQIPKGKIFTKTVHFAVYECPSARERGEQLEYSKGVPEFKTVAEAMAWGMSDKDSMVTPEEWKELVPLVDEA